MKNFTFLFLFVLSFFIHTEAFSEEVAQDQPLLSVTDEDPEIKGLQWNRYVNGNYVILSIDDKQGKWLSDNVNSLSSWCEARWGIEPSSIKKECRIFCVPNKQLLKKLFNIEEPKAEVRRSQDGSIEINVIWVCLDSLNKEQVLPYLSHIVFLNSEKKFPLWFLKSSEFLSSGPDLVSKSLKDEGQTKLFSCKKLISMSGDDYLKLSPEDKKIFNRQAIVLCLMLRKELGQRKLLSFLNSQGDPVHSLSSVYGYDGIEDFESKYNMYYNDLFKELNLNKVPNYYFSIKPIN